MNTKTVCVLIAIIVWSLTSSPIPAEAGATCAGLTGTWTATFKISNSLYTDRFVIKSASSTGAVSGVNEYGYPMHGFCKNGTVYFSEDASDYYQNSYYFTNEKKNFGRHFGVFAYTYDFTSTNRKATIKKISKSTSSIIAQASRARSSSVAPEEIVDMTKEDLKLQESIELEQELQRQENE